MMIMMMMGKRRMIHNRKEARYTHAHVKTHKAPEICGLTWQ